MDPKSEIHATEYMEGALSEVRDGNISGRVEVSSGPAEGNGNLWDAFKLPEMKLGNLEKVSTHSLFTIIKKILDDRIEKKDEDTPRLFASVLKLAVLEIELRVLTQAVKTRELQQSRQYKSCEDRYCSKIEVLETLATGTSEENEVIVTQLPQMILKAINNLGAFTILMLTMI